MEALGLRQHSTTQVMNLINVLYLIFTEIMSDIGVEVMEMTSYISDHCPVIATLNIKKEPVIATLNIKKEQVKQVQRVIHKAAKFSQDEWNQEFNKPNIYVGQQSEQSC